MNSGDSVWVVSHGAPVAGATPVWLVPNDGTFPSAVTVRIAGHGGTVAGGATPVWLAGRGGTPPPGLGAIPVRVGWYGGTAAAPGLTPAQAYLARTVGGNEGGNAANITTLIDGLVTDGVWSKLNCLYIFAQQNVTDAKLNLVSTSFTLPEAGVIFAAYKGYSSFPAFGIDTGLNASTLNPISQSMGTWQYDAPGDIQVQIGTSAGHGDSITLTANDGGGGSSFFAGLGAFSYADTTVPGFLSAELTSTTTAAMYFNGVNPQTDASDSASVPEASTLMIGGVRGDAGSHVTGKMSAAYIGNAAMGATLQLALYNRLRAYMTAVGVP